MFCFCFVSVSFQLCKHFKALVPNPVRQTPPKPLLYHFSKWHGTALSVRSANKREFSDFRILTRSLFTLSIHIPPTWRRSMTISFGDAARAVISPCSRILLTGPSRIVSIPMHQNNGVDRSAARYTVIACHRRQARRRPRPPTTTTSQSNQQKQHPSRCPSVT